MNPPKSTGTFYQHKIITSFGGRGFGRPTFWQACTSVANHEDMDMVGQPRRYGHGWPTMKIWTWLANHEDMDSSFPFLIKWEAHKMQLNSFPVQ